jgi:hypothetical protein
MINNRISDLSCDHDEFEKAKPPYESALRSNGFTADLTYPNKDKRAKSRKKRKRNIIWFNPPYNQQVKTNIGTIFLKLVRKHFPHNHKYSKIFNTNTIKLSYCCTTSMANIIKQHNAKILKSNKPSCQDQRQCNCRSKPNCPMDGQCLSKCIIYKAEVSTETPNSVPMVYYGASESEFKSRYNNHTKSFKHTKYRNETELSKFIWNLKDNKIKHSIKWSIAAHASPYRCGTRRCDLCLSEKLVIIKAQRKNLLNKRSEFISKCRHRNKFLLRNVK